MKKIVLIGFACCGKSTVGKILADKLGYLFVDTDCEIQSRSNLTVAEIFERFGEGKFRQMEIISCSHPCIRALSVKEFDACLMTSLFLPSYVK